MSVDVCQECGESTSRIGFSMHGEEKFSSVISRRRCIGCGIEFETFSAQYSTPELISRARVRVQMDIDPPPGCIRFVVVALCLGEGCANEARYVKEGVATAAYCGIHDILLNDGKGRRVDTVRGAIR